MQEDTESEILDGVLRKVLVERNRFPVKFNEKKFVHPVHHEEVQ